MIYFGKVIFYARIINGNVRIDPNREFDSHGIMYDLIDKLHIFYG